MRSCGIALSDGGFNLNNCDAGGKMFCMTKAVSTVTPARPVKSGQELKIHERGIRYTVEFTWNQSTDRLTLKLSTMWSIDFTKVLLKAQIGLHYLRNRGSSTTSE